MAASARYYTSRERAIRSAPANQPVSIVNIATPARRLPSVDEITTRTRPVGSYKSRSHTSMADRCAPWPLPQPATIATNGQAKSEGGHHDDHLAHPR
jgi:hypothetical protein